MKSTTSCIALCAMLFPLAVTANASSFNTSAASNPTITEAPTAKLMATPTRIETQVTVIVFDNGYSQFTSTLNDGELDLRATITPAPSNRKLSKDRRFPPLLYAHECFPNWPGVNTFWSEDAAEFTPTLKYMDPDGTTSLIVTYTDAPHNKWLYQLHHDAGHHCWDDCSHPCHNDDNNGGQPRPPQWQKLCTNYRHDMYTRMPIVSTIFIHDSVGGSPWDKAVTSYVITAQCAGCDALTTCPPPINSAPWYDRPFNPYATTTAA